MYDPLETKQNHNFDVTKKIIKKFQSSNTTFGRQKIINKWLKASSMDGLNVLFDKLVDFKSW